MKFDRDYGFDYLFRKGMYPELENRDGAKCLIRQARIERRRDSSYEYDGEMYEDLKRDVKAFLLKSLKHETDEAEKKKRPHRSTYLQNMSLVEEISQEILDDWAEDRSITSPHLENFLVSGYRKIKISTTCFTLCERFECSLLIEFILIALNGGYYPVSHEEDRYISEHREFIAYLKTLKHGQLEHFLQMMHVIHPTVKVVRQRRIPSVDWDQWDKDWDNYYSKRKDND